MSDAPPVITGRVIGFRVWRVGLDHRLYSAGAATLPWQAGANTATCRVNEYEFFFDSNPPLVQPPFHEAPCNGCTCGLYAFYDCVGIRFSESPGPVVAGAVAAWGRIETHSHGFRAQYAQPVAFSPMHTMPHFERADIPPGYDEAVERIADIHGVEVVHFDALEAEGLNHGMRVPLDLRPAAPEPRAPGAYVSSVASANAQLVALQRVLHQQVGSRMSVTIRTPSNASSRRYRWRRRVLFVAAAYTIVVQILVFFGVIS